MVTAPYGMAWSCKGLLAKSRWTHAVRCASGPGFSYQQLSDAIDYTTPNGWFVLTYTRSEYCHVSVHEDRYQYLAIEFDSKLYCFTHCCRLGHEWQNSSEETSSSSREGKRQQKQRRKQRKQKDANGKSSAASICTLLLPLLGLLLLLLFAIMAARVRPLRELLLFKSCSNTRPRGLSIDKSLGLKHSRFHEIIRMWPAARSITRAIPCSHHTFLDLGILIKSCSNTSPRGIHKVSFEQRMATSVLKAFESQQISTQP